MHCSCSETKQPSMLEEFIKQWDKIILDFLFPLLWTVLTLEISGIEITVNFKNKYEKGAKTLAQSQSRNIKHPQLIFIQGSIVMLHFVAFIVQLDIIWYCHLCYLHLLNGMITNLEQNLITK